MDTERTPRQQAYDKIMAGWGDMEDNETDLDDHDHYEEPRRYLIVAMGKGKYGASYAVSTTADTLSDVVSAAERLENNDEGVTDIYDLDTDTKIVFEVDKRFTVTLPNNPRSSKERDQV